MRRWKSRSKDMVVTCPDFWAGNGVMMIALIPFLISHFSFFIVTATTRRLLFSLGTGYTAYALKP